MTAAEQYQAELKQSDIDHHTPTAEAMVGHIISNLLIHSLKINQAKLFARGQESLFLNQKAAEWQAYEMQEFNQLNQLLFNNGESIPTTTDQFKEYTMLEEDGATKYEAGSEQLFALVKDFDTQILFITKAIALADKEDWPELNHNLVTLLAWIKEQIRLSQNFLGHDLREGLYTEEDDDDF
ncbi:MULTISPECIES: DNA-binding protein [Lactobacillus]|uniref:DNA-binding protein n=1 Tax=Lactobacillus xujianguonis TaxID=2495899 RepID=A0A437SSS3_9LACO|nr:MULTISPECIES: DNA-binding protein [Lactobacillus]RVU69973.1 DNA-binding protein [Lactobacillus xujianguonis]RVU72379.1 DNA-binding protein [Lactobacillus xujianguonis]